jgi:hypothetical protein
MSYDEKAVVKVNSDGTVAKCAKGLGQGECGFKAGAKVCGKCGAMAIQVKMVPVDELPDTEMPEEEMSEEDMTPEQRAKYMMRMRNQQQGAPSEDAMSMKKRPSGVESARSKADMEDDEEDSYAKPAQNPMADVAQEDEELDMEDDMMEPGAKGWGAAYGKRRKEMSMPSADEMVDEEEDDVIAETPEDEMSPKGMRWGKRMMSAKEDDESMMDDEEMMDEEVDDEEMMDEEDMDSDIMPMRKGGGEPVIPDMEALRMARLRKLGTKSADVGLNGFMCAIERKVYPGSTSVCDDCPGGCMSEKGLPGLLHVEGLAEMMFKGDVIDSGYSSEADMFVVDVQTKSGHVNEIFIDGTTAEVLGFHRLDDSIFEQKSLLEDIELINFNEAAEIAVKAVPGSVVAVEPGVFQGFDAFQVEVDGFDSKSYDVFVALDGEVLGWDKWESDETDEIEAEAAEIALKRAFSEESRQQMAESGEAMEDGSFPIASEADLRNAIMAHGRAKNVDKAKAHIKKRAKELGLEDLLPEEWKASEKAASEQDEVSGEFLKNLIEFELLQTEVDDLK